MCPGTTYQDWGWQCGNESGINGRMNRNHQGSVDAWNEKGRISYSDTGISHPTMNSLGQQERKSRSENAHQRPMKKDIFHVPSRLGKVARLVSCGRLFSKDKRRWYGACACACPLPLLAFQLLSIERVVIRCKLSKIVIG